MYTTDKYIKHLIPHLEIEMKNLSSVFHLITFKCMTDSILASGSDTCTASVEKTMFVLAQPLVSFHRLAGYDL